MRDWPKTIRIGWLNHTLRVFGPLESTEKDSRGQYVCGCEGVTEVRYDATMKPAQQAHTILHEVLHGIRECLLPAGFIKSVGDQGTNYLEGEEIMVSGFADGLALVIRDNPVLFDCIAERLRGDE